MKRTTVILNDRVMDRLRREAARQGRTMSEMMESALRLLFRAQECGEGGGELPELPTFASGGTRVDVSDRGALYDAMEGR